jgi:hypothetical protein
MSETKVKTGKVRFSFCHVHEKHAINPGDKEKYSVCIIIDKSDKKTLSAIDAAVKAAIISGAAKVGSPAPKNLKTPLRDGDIEREDDENFAGKMFLNASSGNKPGIVDKDRNEIMSNDEFYSGCFGRASINFYAYNNQSKGIACGLNNLQKLADGDSFAGKTSAASDFAEDDDFDDLG